MLENKKENKTTTKSEIKEEKPKLKTRGYCRIKNKNCVLIKYRGVEYEINFKKLKAVFSYLMNEEVIINDNKDIRNYLKKYKLYDEGFFENINRIKIYSV